MESLLSISSLEHRHRDTFIHAVTNVLSSPIAEATYTQIVDGLPLADVARDVYHGCVCSTHPLLDKHRELCPGVAEQFQQLRAGFDVATLQMDSQLVHDYQSAPPGSSLFTMRLIELVARAVHQFGVWLYQQDTNHHKNDELGLWRPSETKLRFYPRTYPSTLFCHEWYRDYDQYPEGIADCVGYWAEARIFGGVVLFDRRDPGVVPNAEPHAVYLHPDRSDVIYRIYRLLDDQKQELVQFLLADNNGPGPGGTPQPPPQQQQKCPLPLLPSVANRQRVDPESPIAATGIYRDPWERRLRPPNDGDARLKDVTDTFNYLSREDWREAKKRAGRERAERIRRRAVERRN